MLISESEVRNKMLYVLFKLKENSVEYHDGAHFVAMCKFWNKAKKTSMLRKNVRDIFFTILFKSITKAIFNGVDNLSWVKKILKKEGENGNYERRKRGRFEGWTYFLKTITYTWFYLIFTTKKF